MAVLRKNTLLACIGLVCALSNLGCRDGGADHLLLDRFFAASRLRDRTVLARFATVIFEPNRDGIVEHMTVLATTAPEPLPEIPSGDSRGDSRHVVRLSLDADLDESAPVSAAAVVSRDISVRARIRDERGEVREQIVRVTVQRAETHGPRERTGRWIVTGVR